MKIIITENQLKKLINKNILNESSIHDFDIHGFLARNYVKEYIHSDLVRDMLYNQVSDIIDVISDKIIDGKIRIYRAITVNDNWLEHLKKEGKRLGIYWAWDYNGAEAYWGDFEKPNILIIEAEIDEKYVDWNDTIELNMRFNMDENEIRLFKNTPIKILSLELNDEQLDISEIKDKIFQS